MFRSFGKYILIGSVFTAPTLCADVNVLIIGSEKCTRMRNSDSQAFAPSQIKHELQEILKGAKLGKVNVTLEDSYKNQARSYASNLISWFHWPYPADVETKERWPNLRGEKGTKWDYVVLIGDPYTLEKTPGLYSHGVAKIAEQVTKGTGEIVLLMPWPVKTSSSSVAHYKEVVYRTGRSGGFKVAPAALAWEAAGKPSGAKHPSKDGAYIAAASLYSRIWSKSAKSSTYKFNDKLADIAHKTVNTNIGKKQYMGKFQFQSPFKPFNNKKRVLNPGKSGGGSSTEVDFLGRTVTSLGRAGVMCKKGGDLYVIGRYTGPNPKGKKDYRNRGGRAFGYMYHTEGNKPDVAMANIASWEMFLANSMITQSNDYRLIPRRILLGSLLQFEPNMKIVAGGHVYGSQAIAVSTYISTLITGRCPVDARPAKIDSGWNAQEQGYKMAWRVANCQTRAPGFKVLPSNKSRMTIDFKMSEKMEVNFLFPPKHPVTVKVLIDENVATVSPKTLTFNAENYQTPQQVVVKAKEGIKPTTEMNIKFDTFSKDEVYNDLQDSWKYVVNSPPIANSQNTKAASGKVEAICLTGSDIDKEELTYSLDKKPEHGTVKMDSKGVATYTGKKGYVGSDSFTFKSHDGSAFSKPAKVTIAVSKPSLYNSNLLQNGSGELIPFKEYKWIEKKGKWKQSSEAIDGVYTFAVSEGNLAELVQDVDVSLFSKEIKSNKQSFKIAGAIDASNDEVALIVEFLDTSGGILLTYDSSDDKGKAKRKEKLKSYKSTVLAPTKTTTIRFRLVSINKRGRGNGGRFDGLKLEAVK